MADFTSVPTVELLTRAADAAGKHADKIAAFRRETGPRGGAPVEPAPMEDHWRAVEALLRRQLRRHRIGAEYSQCSCGNWVMRGTGCPEVELLRPLAEQVLQHLGDTE